MVGTLVLKPIASISTSRNPYSVKLVECGKQENYTLIFEIYQEISWKEEKQQIMRRIEREWFKCDTMRNISWYLQDNGFEFLTELLNSLNEKNATVEVLMITGRPKNIHLLLPHVGLLKINFIFMTSVLDMWKFVQEAANYNVHILAANLQLCVHETKYTLSSLCHISKDHKKNQCIVQRSLLNYVFIGLTSNRKVHITLSNGLLGSFNVRQFMTLVLLSGRAYDVSFELRKNQHDTDDIRDARVCYIRSLFADIVIAHTVLKNISRVMVNFTPISVDTFTRKEWQAWLAFREKQSLKITLPGGEQNSFLCSKRSDTLGLFHFVTYLKTPVN